VNGWLARFKVRQLRAEIEINAPAERVWAVLVDFGAYRDWNPFMTSVTGRVEVGSCFSARIEAPSAGARTIKLRMRAVDPLRELRWTGAFPYHLPGLLTGERVITLEPLPGDRVRLVQVATFRGVLVRIVRWMYAYQPGFELMNAALKMRAEAAQ
jgi:hypothetical protein